MFFSRLLLAEGLAPAVACFNVKAASTANVALGLLSSSGFLRSMSSASTSGDPRDRGHPGLPRTRSVEDSSVDGPSGIPRSPDAPADPAEKAHRDTSGLSPEEVKTASRNTVTNSSARAGEALGGRADMLRASPTWHMNQTEAPRDAKEGEQKGPIEGWTAAMVGDGVKMTVKSGAQKVSAALKQMFEGPHSDDKHIHSHEAGVSTGTSSSPPGKDAPPSSGR